MIGRLYFHIRHNNIHFVIEEKNGKVKCLFLNLDNNYYEFYKWNKEYFEHYKYRYRAYKNGVEI